MVRMQKGKNEAQVLFLGNEKSKEWEGPFDVSLSMDEVRNFSLKRPPRAHARPASATVSEVSGRYTPSSEKEMSSDSEASDGKGMAKFEGELDKHLARGRGVGYRAVMDAEIKARALRKTFYCLLGEEWANLNPRYKVGEVVRLRRELESGERRA
jgi:hypothetical protein